MKDLLTFLAIMLAFLILFFGNYAGFAWTVVRWTKKPVKKKVKGKVKLVQPKLSMGERIRCCIPIWQMIEVRKAMYGSASFFAPLGIIAGLLIIFNFVTSFILAINSMLMFIGHICFFVGFILAWILHGIVTADCARLYDFGKLTILLNFLLPHVFCFYIKNNIPHIMSDMRKEQTFEESKDTVIKSKHSK